MDENFVKHRNVRGGYSADLDNISNNSLCNSSVFNTLTSFCVLNDFSSDQISMLNFSANAKNSISLGRGEIFSTSVILSINSSKGTGLIFNLTISMNALKSSCEKPDFNLMFSLFFSNSASNLYGAKKLRAYPLRN